LNNRFHNFLTSLPTWGFVSNMWKRIICQCYIQTSPWYRGPIQGDRIGRIFALWAIFYFIQFNFINYFLTKYGLGYILGNCSQKSSGHPDPILGTIIITHTFSDMILAIRQRSLITYTASPTYIAIFLTVRWAMYVVPTNVCMYP
jgi:hypothetical protein